MGCVELGLEQKLALKISTGLGERLVVTIEIHSEKACGLFHISIWCNDSCGWSETYSTAHYSLCGKKK